MFKKKLDKIDPKEVNQFFYLSNKVLHVIFLLVTILLVLVATYIIKEWNIVGVIKTILSIISPVFIGFVLAWLLDPLATRLSNKMPRALACTITYLGTLGAIILMLVLVVPSFGEGISEIASTLPKVIEQSQEVVEDFFDRFKDNKLLVGYKKDSLEKIENFGSDLTKTLPTVVFNFAKGVVNTGTSLVLGIMIGFYLLFDFRKFQGHILSLLPYAWHSGAKDLMRRINGRLRSYVQGVLLVMLLVFVTQSIGLSLAGLKAPIVFAFFCAITDVIPYIGPWIGGIPAVIVGFTIDPMVGIFTIIAIFVCQTLENNFYQPLIMGKTMCLHPVTIILGLLLFSHFFGMIGMIVATPVIASLKIIFEFVLEKTDWGEKFHNYQNKDKEETVIKKSIGKEKVIES